MADITEEDFIWMVKYINALPNSIQLDQFFNIPQNISLQIDQTVISVERFNKCISVLNSAPNDATDYQREFLKHLKRCIHTHEANNPNEVFELWYKMEIYPVQTYKCLDTDKLDVRVEIPHSLSMLLTDALTREYETNQPDAQIECHTIKTMISIKNTEAPSMADTVAQMVSQLSTLTIDSEHEAEITDINALLALLVVLKCYPDKWKELFFWNAWLAVTIQLHLLGAQGNTDREVYPCLWMNEKGVFFAERLVDPKNIRCLLLGQDPVSKGDTQIRRATGIAFHNIGNNNPSIFNMGKYYGLNCSDDKPVEHCRNGIFMVNMIRCIFKNSQSMSNNIFRKAWTTYTLKLADHFNKQDKVIIVFCKSRYMPRLANHYLPRVVSESKFMDVHHPSRLSYHDRHYNFNYHERDVQKYLKELQDVAYVVAMCCMFLSLICISCCVVNS